MASDAANKSVDNAAMELLKKMETKAEELIAAKAQLITLRDSQRISAEAAHMLALNLDKDGKKSAGGSESVWMFTGTLFLKHPTPRAHALLVEESGRIQQEVEKAREEVRTLRNEYMSLEELSIKKFAFNLRPLSPEELAFLDQRM